MEQIKHKILSQTANGKVFKCSTCDKIHFEYKNLNFTFSKEKFVLFIKFFLEIDPEEWECLNQNSFYNRKIMVPIGNESFYAMFHAAEIYELKKLLRGTKGNSNTFEMLNLGRIETHLCEN